jgi:hypothetical protein
MTPQRRGAQTIDRRSFLRQARLGAGAWLAHTRTGLEAADGAGSLKIQPYPLIPEAEPLPPSRLAERLAEDGYALKAERFRNQSQTELASVRKYRQHTLVIAWEKAPGAKWALNIVEWLRAAGEKKNAARMESFAWQPHDKHNCRATIEFSNPKCRLNCAFKGLARGVDCRLELELQEEVPWKNVVGHSCFNHLWAPGYGRDAYVLLEGGPRRLDRADPDGKTDWLRFVTLKEAPDYAPFFNPVYRNAEGRFIATGGNAGKSACVGISSRSAVSVSWSFWPCTDMDFAFGNPQPFVPVTVDLKLHFLPLSLQSAIDTLRA